MPYWLRGYSHLAYLLDDEDMLKETKFWIDAVMASQKEDGFFGPLNLRDGKPEVWAQMIMLWVLQNWHEYTADNQPFTLGSVPLEVTALGRLIPSWGIDDTGITGVLPPASAKRSDAVSPLTLVPMGAARLRISAFPTSEK